MPALVMEMVCCSMASWMATWSPTSILSNSSMQHTELSASIRAPASMQYSPVSGSLTTAAVRPALEEALPLVYTAWGRKPVVHFRNCDFAVEGSPTTQTFKSPRSLVGRAVGVRVRLCTTRDGCGIFTYLMPSEVSFCTPPRSMRRTPFLMVSFLVMLGAILSSSKQTKHTSLCERVPQQCLVTRPGGAVRTTWRGLRRCWRKRSSRAPWHAPPRTCCAAAQEASCSHQHPVFGTK